MDPIIEASWARSHSRPLSLAEQIAGCLRCAEQADSGFFDRDNARLAVAFRRKAARLQAQLDRIARSWATDANGAWLFNDEGREVELLQKTQQPPGNTNAPAGEGRGVR